jgi:hypothetical protein
VSKRHRLSSRLNDVTLYLEAAYCLGIQVGSLAADPRSDYSCGTAVEFHHTSPTGRTLRTSNSIPGAAECSAISVSVALLVDRLEGNIEIGAAQASSAHMRRAYAAKPRDFRL